MVGLNAQEKIEKNILLFQYQLEKNLMIVKQLHTNYILLVALDLCLPHYQNLLIIYLKFIAEGVKNVNQYKNNKKK